MTKVIIVGRDFKALVEAVTKYPSLGSFAGTELISLIVKDGKLIATTTGVAMSWGAVPAEGKLPFIGVGERETLAFAGICHDSAKVLLLVDDKQIRMKCRRREIVLPFAAGRDLKAPQVAGTRIEVTKELAERLGYLSDIAYDDTTKPELCCVMLAASGQAIAVNQKAIASLKYRAEGTANVAIPVLLAKTLSKGDVIFAGVKETFVHSANKIVTYCLPSPVKAQSDFPVTTVVQFGTAERQVLCTFDGAKFAAVVVECNAILSAVTRTEIFLDLTIGAEKMEVGGENGSIKFKAEIPMLSASVEDAVKVPIEEMLHVAAFLDKETTIAKGVRGEVFFSFALGWTMFPRWKAGRTK